MMTNLTLEEINKISEMLHSPDEEMQYLGLIMLKDRTEWSAAIDDRRFKEYYMVAAKTWLSQRAYDLGVAHGGELLKNQNNNI